MNNFIDLLAKGFRLAFRSSTLAWILILSPIIFGLLWYGIEKLLPVSEEDTINFLKGPMGILMVMSFLVFFVGLFPYFGGCYVGSIVKVSKAPSLSLKEFFENGKRYYWSFLVYMFLLALCGFGAALLIGFPLIELMESFGAFDAVKEPSFEFNPEPGVALTVSALVIQTAVSFFVLPAMFSPVIMVLKNQSAGDSIVEAYGLAKKHIKEMLGLWFVFIVFPIAGENFLFQRFPGGGEHIIGVLTLYVEFYFVTTMTIFLSDKVELKETHS